MSNISTVIKEAKRLKYDSKIKKSSNKNKTSWDIVKSETSKTTTNENIHTLNIDGKLTSNHQRDCRCFQQILSTSS
jgi:hypothetical protein